MEQSKERLRVLEKIKELEKAELWHQDVEDDPETFELLPNKVDYLNKKLINKISNFLANAAGTRFFEKLIKNKQLIIDKVEGIENFLKVKGGMIITCNHFNACDNYAVWRVLKPYMKGQKLYKVIREGNFTNPPKPFGFIMKHCNTLPLSSNTETMKLFMKAVSTLIVRGEKILIYPEQGMWWNYKKPRPLQNGAFRLAVSNTAPVLPIFITMQDSDVLDSDGFFVQKYTLHILPAIYPNKELSKKESIEQMKKENYEAWVSCYEKTYGKKLSYKED